MRDLSKISIVHDDSHVGMLYYPDDYQQIRQEIIESIIKRNSREWQIKKMCVFDGDYWSRNCGSEKFGWGYKEMEICLVHQNFEVGYSDHGELITDADNGGWIHFKRGFSASEWQEIEQVISSQIQHQAPNNDNKKNSWFFVYLFVGVLALMLGYFKLVNWFKRP